MENTCPTCRIKIRKTSKYCTSHSFFGITFKEKCCVKCKIAFIPNSGVQKFCKNCTICTSCGKHKGIDAKHCIHCTVKINRINNNICVKCGQLFDNKNNIAKTCKKCNEAFCIDCKKQIGTSHKRCNSCAAKYRFAIGTYSKKGWQKYEFDGSRYRSNWEVDFV